MKVKMDGHFGAQRQRVKNTLDANAFEVIGGLLSGTILTEYSESIRLLDSVDAEIVTGVANWSFTSDATSVEITGTRTFTEGEMTADAHKAQLLSNAGRVMAEATFPMPLPASEAVVVTRVDTITAV